MDRDTLQGVVRCRTMPLAGFHPFIAELSTTDSDQPTEVQQRAWPAIQSAADPLIAAPTSSGKMLAVFLS